jgi:beta-glucosidase
VKAEDRQIEDLISQMTLEEKVAMCAGSGMWHSTPIERLGIPALKMTDGPNGARGDSASGATAACFPVGSALAATWNVDLIEEVGKALGQEARSKGAQVLLGPTINIHRTPLGGRNFECYSEDPYLTARLAVHYTLGVESQNVSVCLKHFICNDSEFERHTISSDVGERALREIYLAPFEAAIKEAGAHSVMSSYNRVNGVYAASHKELLTGVLKNEWGFGGFVVSDWGGSLETTDNANGGLDMEMPGPARTMGKKLIDAAARGEVSEATLDDKVRRILAVTKWTGKIKAPQEVSERSEDRPEHRALALQAAIESMVLLKNEGVLPLPKAELKSVAIIGPNAKHGQIQGGGSSGVAPHYQSHPLDALVASVGPKVDVRYEPGCLTHKFAPPIDLNQLTPPGGEQGDGFFYSLFSNDAFSGPAQTTGFEKRNKISFFGAFANIHKGGPFSVRYESVFTPDITGPFEFGLISSGLARLFIDDVEVIDNWTKQTPGDAFYAHGSTEKRNSIFLELGKPYKIRIDFVRPPKKIFPGVQFGVLPPTPDNLIERAVEAARDADATLLVVGTNSDWETEGNDRENLSLPGDQLSLIKAVLGANPETIVVVNAGSPIEMPWIDQAKSVFFTWFAGQEFGNGLMDLIFGEANPSARLPTTFPIRIEDTPSFITTPNEPGHLPYTEGLFVGYRWYDHKAITPLFPFGFGLSYTGFKIESLSGQHIANVGEPVALQMEVSNIGDCDGQVVVQVYVQPIDPKVERPEKELKAFEKVALKANETRRIEFTLAPRSFAYWSPERKDWTVDPGEFEVIAATSSGNLGPSLTVKLI